MVKNNFTLGKVVGHLEDIKENFKDVKEDLKDIKIRLDKGGGSIGKNKSNIKILQFQMAIIWSAIGVISLKFLKLFDWLMFWKQ